MELEQNVELAKGLKKNWRPSLQQFQFWGKKKGSWWGHTSL